MAAVGGRDAKEVVMDGRLGASGEMENGCGDGGNGEIARVGSRVVICRGGGCVARLSLVGDYVGMAAMV